jgi:hypothetical protein
VRTVQRRPFACCVKGAAMSLGARRMRKSERHLCSCGHKALYDRPGWGDIAFRKDHPLCFRCHASVRSASRAVTVGGRARARVRVRPGAWRGRGPRWSSQGETIAESR